jgi:hypothetical protein
VRRVANVWPVANRRWCPKAALKRNVGFRIADQPLERRHISGTHGFRQFEGCFGDVSVGQSIISMREDVTQLLGVPELRQ